MKGKNDAPSGRCYSEKEMYDLYMLTIDSSISILKYAYKNIYKAGSILTDYLNSIGYQPTYFPGYYIADESKAITAEINKLQNKKAMTFEDTVSSGMFLYEDGTLLSKKDFNDFMGKAITKVFYSYVIGTNDEKNFRSVASLFCVGDDREMLEDIFSCIRFSKEDLSYGVLHDKFFKRLNAGHESDFGFIEGNKFSLLASEINFRTRNAHCKKLLKQGKLCKALKVKVSNDEVFN